MVITICKILNPHICEVSINSSAAKETANSSPRGHHDDHQSFSSWSSSLLPVPKQGRIGWAQEASTLQEVRGRDQLPAASPDQGCPPSWWWSWWGGGWWVWWWWWVVVAMDQIFFELKSGGPSRPWLLDDGPLSQFWARQACLTSPFTVTQVNTKRKVSTITQVNTKTWVSTKTQANSKHGLTI